MLKKPQTVPTANRATCLLMLSFLLAGANAYSQVIRCVDPSNGQISYTDGSCAKGTGTTIAPARTPAEVTQDDERALAARQRWEAEQRQQKLAAPPKTDATPPSPPPERINQACKAAQAELHALSQSNSSQTAAVEAAQRHMEMQCLGPDGYAALERSRANALAPGESTVVIPPHHARPPHRPAPPREPIQRLNCNVFRCFDQNGNAMPAPRPGEVR